MKASRASKYATYKTHFASGPATKKTPPRITEIMEKTVTAAMFTLFAKKQTPAILFLMSK